MNIENNIKAFVQLGDYIIENPVSLQEIVHKTYVYNTWFTIENTNLALQNIATEFLNKEKLENWLSTYDSRLTAHNSKTIALVAAGNIPLVAFHDILSVLITGNKLQIKLSEKDKFLYPFLLDKLIEFDPDFADKIKIKERLENFDAVIATGSNNTAKHFEYYFKKYKHIIRRNRNSVAVLDGNETTEELHNLGHDIFDYFGLGCRNVSKIFIPEDYDILKLKDGLAKHINVNQHNQYMNNLDYQRTVYLMNQVPLLDIDFVNITENSSMHSPISCLHFERYTSLDVVKQYIADEKENIQCIVGNVAIDNIIPFGKSQQPALTDYADNVDTIEFIFEI
ncbi:MAG: acyl-CoA reductase [Chitinophagales bacterium]